MKKILKIITPSFFWKILQRLNYLRQNWIFELIDKRGYAVVRKSDYYSPLPILDDLLANEKRWNRPTQLVGVDIDKERIEQHWQLLHNNFKSEYEQLPTYEEILKLGYGVGFTKTDARTLYYCLRHIKPQKYIEIGSGVSTYYASLAAQANNKEGYPLSIICIEPFPKDNFNKIENIDFHKAFVQDVPLSFFEQLEPGDVLFIDSSHAAKIDSDVTYELLEIVPRLKKGVHIHIHDIPFPYNFPYPADLYIFGKKEPMLWNEPILVQAFLAFNDSFKVTLSLPYLNYHHAQLIHETIPERTEEVTYSNVIGSLWLEKVR